MRTAKEWAMEIADCVDKLYKNEDKEEAYKTEIEYNISRIRGETKNVLADWIHENYQKYLLKNGELSGRFYSALRHLNLERYDNKSKD